MSSGELPGLFCLCSSKYSSSDLIYPLWTSCVCSGSSSQNQVPPISWIHIALRVKSSSTSHQLPHTCLSLSGQAAWLFLENAINTKGWGIWAVHEVKSDMTEQLDNQLLESAAIKHLQPRQRGEWHGAVLRLRVYQLNQQLPPPEAGGIWEEQIIYLQLLCPTVAIRCGRASRLDLGHGSQCRVFCVRTGLISVNAFRLL